MPASPEPGVRQPFPLACIVPFLLVTFGLAWGIIGLYIFLPAQMAAAFGELSGRHPLFYLAVYAPAIAAFTVVARRSGAGGLKRFLSRLRLWRCSPLWYAFLIVVVPLVFIGGSAWKGNLFKGPFPFASLPAAAAAMFFMAIKGPVEELGWRGFALPLLQRKLAPFWAGLVVGILWGIWHLPAFMLSGTPQSAWPFAPFFLGSVAISVIATRLFNAARGSILLPALFHFQLINPLWPDAQPYDTYILIGVAAFIVWLNRGTMFARTGGVSEIIPAAGNRPAAVGPGHAV